MTSKNKYFSTISILKIITYLLFVLFVYEKSYKQDYFNYDGIPYVASAHMLTGEGLVSSHAYAWNLLRSKSQPGVFNDLCCASSYRKSMYQSFEAFGSHLPSYQTKSLYVLTVRVISSLLNIDEFEALKLISFASVILLSFLAAFFLFNKSFILYISIFPILILMQIIPMARLLTPDSFNALLMFSAATCFLSQKKTAGYGIMLASILVRQTNIILFALFLLFELKERKYLKLILYASLGLLIYFLNSSLFESIGYWKTYYSSLIRMPDTFVGFNPPFELSLICSTLIGKLNWMLGNPELNRFPALMLILLSLSLLPLKEKSYWMIEKRLVPFIFTIGAIISFALIPFPDFRIYAGFLIAASLSLIANINEKRLTDKAR